MRFALGVFIVLHGLVHLLYMGQSARFFELKPGMVWPDGSWAFSRLVGDPAVRNLASIALALAAAGLVAGGFGMFLDQAWSPPVIVGAVAFSSILYILFWNGVTRDLDGQGIVGLLINIAILIAVLMFEM